jgi:hypothetical protein
MVEHAKEIAVNIGVPDMDGMEMDQLRVHLASNRIVPALYFQEGNLLAEILRDTWRRFWRCLVIMDHDFRRSDPDADVACKILFRSDLIELTIDPPQSEVAALNYFVCSTTSQPDLCSVNIYYGVFQQKNILAKQSSLSPGLSKWSIYFINTM